MASTPDLTAIERAIALSRPFDHMNIVHLSTADISGGASRAAMRIHQGLLNEGVNSRMCVRHKLSSEHTVESCHPAFAKKGLRNQVLRRIKAKIRKTRNNAISSFKHGDWDWFSSNSPDEELGIDMCLQDADIIHLHWITNFVDAPSFFTKTAPSGRFVWTLHDMNPFTGGCHYDAHCGKYKQRCGSCPALGSIREGDISRKIWREKHNAFMQIEPSKLKIVGDSKWLADCARESSLLSRFETSSILYGLDHIQFRPMDRSSSRKALGIPEDSNVLVFCADRISNTRKGLPILLNAIRTLNKIPNLYLLAIGNGSQNIASKYPIHFTGPLNDDQQLARAYSSGDVFVIPSKQEAFGQVTLEAMACGVPAVGFAVGGIVDLIKHNHNGILVHDISSSGLAKGIKKLLSEPNLRKQLAKNCRPTVEKYHTLQSQALQYIDIYRSHLNSV